MLGVGENISRKYDTCRVIITPTFGWFCVCFLTWLAAGFPVFRGKCLDNTVKWGRTISFCGMTSYFMAIHPPAQIYVMLKVSLSKTKNESVNMAPSEGKLQFLVTKPKMHIFRAQAT